MLDRLGVPRLPLSREMTEFGQPDANPSQRKTFILQLPSNKYGILFFGIGFEVDTIGAKLPAVGNLAPCLFLLVALAAILDDLPRAETSKPNSSLSE